MYDFYKNYKSKSRLDQKLCKFLFFYSNIIFDKLSKLRQIFYVIPYYIEIKDSLHFPYVLVHLLENWCNMRKIIA